MKGLTEGAREQQLNPKLIALAAKIDEIETILHSGGLERVPKRRNREGIPKRRES